MALVALCQNSNLVVQSSFGLTSIAELLPGTALGFPDAGRRVPPDHLRARTQETVLASPDGSPIPDGIPAASFASVTLRDASGQPTGILAVLDAQPRSWAADELRVLEDLARLAELAVRDPAEDAPHALRTDPIPEHEATEARPDVPFKVGSDPHESKEHYQRIVELCPEAIAILQDAHFQVINQAGLAILGATRPDQVVGRFVLDFIHEDSRRQVVEQITLGPPQQTTTLPDQKVVRLDGRTITVQALIAPISYQGRPASQLAFRDVSALRLGEQAVRREMERLTTIIRTQADIMALDLDIHRVMRLVAERTAAMTGAPAASIGLTEGDAIRYYHGTGLAMQEDSVLLPLEGGLTQLCLDTGETVYCSDSETDDRVNRTTCRQLDIRSLVCVPLKRDGRSVGVVTIYSPEPHAFTDFDVRTMELMGGFVAAAMIHATEFEMRQAATTALRETETRFRYVWETSADGMRLTDENGTIMMVNEAYCRLFGMTEDQLVGQPLSVAYKVDNHAVSRLQERVRNRKLLPHMERPAVLADGRSVWLEVSNSLIEREGQNPLVLSIFRDATARKASEEALQRYRLLAQNAHDIMLFMTLDGAILEANDAAIRAYGYSRDELLRMSVHELRQAPRDVVDALLKQAASAPLMYNSTHLRRDGSTFPVEVNLQCTQIADQHVLLGVARDTTERTAFQEQLEHQAFHDPLTGLPNRALFMDRLRHALVAAHERGRRIGLLFLDVDRFKMVNDSLGHHAGDQLLVAIAGRLRACIRGTDTAARFGGDEFTILVTDINTEGDVTRTAERVLRKLQAPFDINGQEVYVTASVGVAVSNETTLDPDQFLRDTDVAMYQAKTSGRARHAVFACEMSTDARERLQLETDLRRAIEREEFTVYYQPIVLMETRQTIGIEALVRWNHPRFGLMSPDAFVPLQEQIGLIEPFTMWVLREAQTQCLALQKQGMFLSVSVNLSVHNLLDPGFAGKVGTLLSETGLSPAALKLEITESAVMTNPVRALDILTALNRQGVRLSIDDFGTGYSSLAYLKQLPVQEIKIDKSFVMGMDLSDDDDVAIVRATVDLAHNLRKKVVAEGVENVAAWDLLNSLGCDAAQGFHMARPMPASQLHEWLRTSPFGLSDLFI